MDARACSRTTRAFRRIVTTALLPVTLVTGIFGMNVGGLPLLESPHGFWWVMLGMTLVVIGTMIFLRRSQVL
jgi:zinc transporter